VSLVSRVSENDDEKTRTTGGRPFKLALLHSFVRSLEFLLIMLVPIEMKRTTHIHTFTNRQNKTSRCIANSPLFLFLFLFFSSSSSSLDKNLLFVFQTASTDRTEKNVTLLIPFFYFVHGDA
jgi:hypothetical protein